MAAAPNAACAAVVVHYGGLDDTRACLDSLARAGESDEAATTAAPAPVVFLVDNSPTGDGAALARRDFPAVRTLVPGANLGFAGGNNLGLHAALEAGAETVLLLNNDATLEPFALARLEATLARERPRGAGVVTGKILLPGAPPLIWAAGGRLSPLRGIGLNIGEGEVDRGQHDTPADIAFASGCLLLIDRAVLERVGLFDERYFLYLEDVDLCLRARRAGFRVIYEPTAVARHRVHGASSPGMTRPSPVAAPPSSPSSPGVALTPASPVAALPSASSSPGSSDVGQRSPVVAPPSSSTPPSTCALPSPAAVSPSLSPSPSAPPAPPPARREPSLTALYYLTRNRHFLVRRHFPALYPLFLAYNVAARGLNLSKNFFFLGRRQRARVEMRGFLDGLLGRGGEGRGLGREGRP